MAEGGTANLAEVYRRVRRLKLRVLRPVRTHLTGAYASAFRGPGVEFHEFAPYQPGDDVRHLDWQVTARRREPYVKRYVEERELRLILALDVSASMDAYVAQAPPPALPESLRERACTVAAMAGLSAAYSGDRVGAVFIGGDDPLVIPPARGESHALCILHEALTRHPGAGCTDLRPALERLRNLRGHAAVLLLSDFLTEPAIGEREVRRLLCACADKHRVWAVVLRGPSDGDLPHGVILEARDAESGRAVHVDLHGRGAVRADEAYRVHAREVTHVLAGCRVPALDLGYGEDPAQRVFGFLASGGRLAAP